MKSSRAGTLCWTSLLLLACGPTAAPAGSGGSGGSGGVPSSHWSFFGQDLKSSFNNAGETLLSKNNASTLTIAWKKTDLGAVNGTLAVYGELAFVLTTTGMYALRVATGELVWANTAVRGASSPTYSDGVLFVNDSRAALHALRAGDGVQLWQAQIDPHPQAAGLSSPLVYDRYVIVGSSSGDEIVNYTTTSTFRGSVVAYDRSTGAELWRKYTVDPPFNGATVWSSLAIDTELQLVYGTTGNNYTGNPSATSDSIFALHLNDGSVAWWTQLSTGDVYTVPFPNSPDSDFGTNPILFEADFAGYTRKLVGAGQKSGMFWTLDRQTGAIVWSRQVSPGSGLIGGVFNNGAFDGKHVLVAGNLGTSTGPGSEPYNGESNPNTNPKPTPGTSVLEALDPATGAVVWERQLPAWVWAPITIANGVGFVAYEKHLQAFDVQNGQKLFSYQTAGTITSAPACANGAVFFGSGLSYYAGFPDQTIHALKLPQTGSGGSGGSSGAGGSGGSQPATFTNVYTRIVLAKGCSASFCHASGAGNLAMATQPEAYTNLVGIAAAGPSCGTSGQTRVVPGSPEASLLFEKISKTAPSCGTSMPPNQVLATEEVQLVRDWIARGAPND